MSTTPGDRSSPLAELRARTALREAGLDPAMALERASSVTNEAWLGAGHVVRVSGELSGRLAREAELARHLAPETGYPPIVAHGTGVGDDWLVLRRVVGRPLAHVWPDLGRDDRRRAVAEVAGRLHALHTTPFPTGLAPLSSPPHLLAPGTDDPIAPAAAALAAARDLSHVDRGLLADLEALVATWRPALRGMPATHLVHGDLTFENLLWHDGHVTALLDLEWARPGPADLDLDVLLRVCAHPGLHVAAEHERRSVVADYVDVPTWLAEDYPQLFAAPQLLDRLRAYCLSFDVRDLLRHPPTGRNVPQLHPLDRLRRLARGDSHVDRLHALGAIPA